MLHLAATTGSNATRHALRPMVSSVLQRATTAKFVSSPVTRQQSSWTKSSSSSSGSQQNQRRRYQVQVPALAQLKRQQQQALHRPQVNGQAVPFHISELAMVQQQSRASGTPMLAPPRHYESDLVVVLDMDECLIHSQFLASSPTVSSDYAHQLLRNKTSYNNTSSTCTAVESFRFQLPHQGDTVHVHLRPGLAEFLHKVCERFETHIFTAAKDIYANPLLDHIDPEGKLAGRWFRESCVYDASRRAYVKNLSHFRPLLDRVVLVDNNPLSFLHQPENGILVSNFYDDATDTTLESVYQLLEELDESGADVRPVLEEKFGLASALAELTNGPSVRPAPAAAAVAA
ncbi:hypothetical protein MPSEU_000929100 [Mayamaea pseudoterrestris]|nr:hypothetical protein MPSEU_000929100 [Mayamaea pseudoterrestris]